MTTHSVLFSSWGHRLEHATPGDGGVSSTATMKAGLGGVVQRRLNDGHCMVDSCWAGEQSGAMVSSMAGLARVFASIYMLEMSGRKMAEVTSEACA